MAKNFGSAGSAKTIKEVAKASAEKAQVIVVKMIASKNLHDYPKNHEDVSDTTDLENSIQQLGFIDPIEVTGYGQADGEFMIVSGHRRRSAGEKCGVVTFPCIVKSFSSDEEVHNYVLLANSQRDSAKDPLLFCKRYKMHEEYLKSTNFSGKVRDEIAKRLGISTPQADRYNTMNKVIMPVWDMVRDEVVGMSSVLPMASHTPEEQASIYDIMQECVKAKVNLTRDTMKLIVDGYRDGKKTWAEISNAPRDSGMPLNGFINTEPSESRDPKEYDRNDEVRREFDPIAAEADKADADRAAWEAQQEEQGEENGDETEPKEKKPPMTDEEKQAKRAKDILKDLEKLNTCLSEIYKFDDADEAKEAIQNMTSTFSVIIDEMYSISREYDLDKEFTNAFETLKKKVSEY